MAWSTWKVLAFTALTKGLLTVVKRHFLVWVKLDNAGNITENGHQRPNWEESKALPILNTAVPGLNSASVTECDALTLALWDQPPIYPNPASRGSC